MRTKLRRFMPALIAFSLPVVGANAAPNQHSTAEFTFTWNAADSVTVSSTKDLSNVVILYCSGESVKFDNLSVGQQETFSGDGAISSISAKAGTSTGVVWSPYGCDTTGDGGPR